MSQNNGREPQGPPIVYPTLNVRGVDYRLKFSLGAVIALEDMGMTMPDLQNELNRWKPTTNEAGEVIPGQVKPSILMKVIRACLPEECNISLRALADEFDPTDFPMLITKVGEAFAKMRPAAVKLQEPAAIQERPTVQ
jgi:hypothetical protein